MGDGFGAETIPLLASFRAELGESEEIEVAGNVSITPAFGFLDPVLLPADVAAVADIECDLIDEFLVGLAQGGCESCQKVPGGFRAAQPGFQSFSFVTLRAECGKGLVDRLDFGFESGLARGRDQAELDADRSEASSCRSCRRCSARLVNIR